MDGLTPTASLLPQATPGYRELVQAERGRDQAFRLTALGTAALVLVTLGAILLALVAGGAPAFKAFGWRFFISQTWDPVQHIYGALPAIYGTLVTSLIAIALAVPVSFGIALFLTELCPLVLRRPISIAIELLAGIPSGMWGLFVLAPVLSETVQPRLTDWFGNLWVIGPLFQGPPIGIGLLPASLVLSIMVIPFVTSVMREVFSVVPAPLKESAYGLGASTWEVVWKIVLPYTRVGVMGGIMLGLGRALGETMAVTFLIGNNNQISPSLFEAGNSIASALANEFAEAHDPLHSASLISLGLILFIITFCVLAAARLLIARASRGEGSK